MLYKEVEVHGADKIEGKFPSCSRRKFFFVWAGYSFLVGTFCPVFFNCLVSSLPSFTVKIKRRDRK